MSLATRQLSGTFPTLLLMSFLNTLPVTFTKQCGSAELLTVATPSRVIKEDGDGDFVSLHAASVINDKISLIAKSIRDFPRYLFSSSTPKVRPKERVSQFFAPLAFVGGRVFFGPMTRWVWKKTSSLSKSFVSPPSHFDDEEAQQVRKCSVTALVDRSVLVISDWTAAAESWLQAGQFLLFINTKDDSWGAAPHQQSVAGRTLSVIYYNARTLNGVACRWSAFEGRCPVFRGDFSATYKLTGSFVLFTLLDSQYTVLAEVIVKHQKALKTLLAWVANCQVNLSRRIPIRVCKKVVLLTVDHVDPVEEVDAGARVSLSSGPDVPFSRTVLTRIQRSRHLEGVYSTPFALSRSPYLIRVDGNPTWFEIRCYENDEGEGAAGDKLELTLLTIEGGLDAASGVHLHNFPWQIQGKLGNMSYVLFKATFIDFEVPGVVSADLPLPSVVRADPWMQPQAHPCEWAMPHNPRIAEASTENLPTEQHGRRDASFRVSLEPGVSASVHFVVSVREYPATSTCWRRVIGSNSLRAQCRHGTYAERFTTKILLNLAAVPILINSDRSKAFTDGVIQELANKFGMSSTICSSFHPQLQGLAEQLHKDCKGMTRSFTEESYTRWYLLAPSPQWWVRSSCERYNANFTLYELLLV